MKSPSSLPMYKQALLRMCQLQLRICTKLIEIHRSRQPETLKQAARRTILGLNGSQVVDGLAGILPREMLAFLRVPTAWDCL